ncbi:tyrosine-type recombinase/integrase [Megalodesulfovibrio paquesii]
MGDRKWTKAGKGIEYRDHATRKHGVRPDRYYRIRYAREGKDVAECLGWASEGWTLDKATLERARIVQAIKSGEGHQSLSEKREAVKARREMEEAAARRAAAEGRTFLDIFETEYLPAQSTQGKKPVTIANERSIVRRWLGPALGDRPLKDISPFDLEKLKASMAKAGKTPRTCEYALAVFRQVHNFATRHNLLDAFNPMDKVKAPRRDNRRQAFLTHEQAATLLDELAKHSQDVHDQALISLHTGARAGEIFRLKWQDINLAHGVITLMDTKNGQTRQAIMTAEVRAMLQRRKPGAPAAFVFTTKDGQPVAKVSKTFERVVASLGFNEGVDDERHRLCFHSLRHTFASWMAMSGADVFTLKEAMGHKTLAMTMRYSHLMPSHLKKAVAGFEASLQQAHEAKARKVVALRKIEGE